MEEKVRQFLKGKFGDAVLSEDNFRGDQSFFITAESLFPICEALQDNDEIDVKYLADITAVDWQGHESDTNGRFEIVYNLYSLSHCYRFFLRIRLSESNPSIRSITDLWAGANWMEREIYDMFGITFEGHPDLTRILTPDGFEGHPLRKDFPITYEQPVFNWNKDNPTEVIK
ncbi:MAG: NADH-quinone oxidoreductase subunit C [Candidatus Zixiibacteriota bacterium]|nr:MAG: NADH-quinone oxidoreductase subunit C [candidate division Zixibacteria bacterium]